MGFSSPETLMKQMGCAVTASERASPRCEKRDLLTAHRKIKSRVGIGVEIVGIR
jgi:hypothetical protein